MKGIRTNNNIEDVKAKIVCSIMEVMRIEADIKTVKNIGVVALGEFDLKRKGSKGKMWKQDTTLLP